MKGNRFVVTLAAPLTFLAGLTLSSFAQSQVTEEDCTPKRPCYVIDQRTLPDCYCSTDLRRISGPDELRRLLALDRGYRRETIQLYSNGQPTRQVVVLTNDARLKTMFQTGFVVSNFRSNATGAKAIFRQAR